MPAPPVPVFSLTGAGAIAAGDGRTVTDCRMACEVIWGCLLFLNIDLYFLLQLAAFEEIESALEVYAIIQICQASSSIFLKKSYSQ